MLIRTYSCLLNKGSNSVKIKKRKITWMMKQCYKIGIQMPKNSMPTTDIKKNLKIFFHYHIILIPCWECIKLYLLPHVN